VQRCATVHQMADGQRSTLSGQSGHRVAALVLPGVLTFDLTCAVQVFARAPDWPSRKGLYDYVNCGVEAVVPSADGFTLTLDSGLDAVASADTVIVPGYAGFEEPPPAAAVRALAAAAERGARVMSICVGAFALAHAGLLDGRRATTHWMATRQLAEAFPKIAVLPDVLYVDEGDVLTSAGIAAGLDLCLHVVRCDHGAEVAAELARFNVIAPHRDGGQAQFIRRPVAESPGAGLAATRAWALANLDHRIGVAELAAHACCSERTLTRRFHAETGVSPKRWLSGMRLEHARELLESTSSPVEEVASRAGFPSAAALRARFTEDLHTTPTGYRRAFRGKTLAA
jgi:transcriptional regulator GlxA family with amidase domain